MVRCPRNLLHVGKGWRKRLPWGKGKGKIAQKGRHISNTEDASYDILLDIPRKFREGANLRVNWKRYCLHLLVVDRTEQQACSPYVGIAYNKNADFNTEGKGAVPLERRKEFGSDALSLFESVCHVGFEV